MIDDDLYYILLDEVQLVPRFEALPKISENTQIFLAEISENTQIFLAEILENTQIFYNIVVVLPTLWWHIADYLPRKSGSGVVVMLAWPSNISGIGVLALSTSVIVYQLGGLFPFGWNRTL